MNLNRVFDRILFSCFPKNICGSCGKKAIPLALLGAEVTVFDISETNRKYAMETAKAAGVKIRYDVCEIIINSIIGNGFTLERFDEHPSWENEKLPGEFTAIARKYAD